MRKTALVSAALLCGVFSVAHAADNNAAPSATVSVPAVVPFAQDAVIAGAVKRECQLGEKLSGFIKKYGQEKGVAVTQVASVGAGSAGRALVLEITDSVADGNAFLGHHTYTTVKGRLYQDGTEVGHFIGRRNSMGGAFGGFKGNCSVLGRTVKALGEDIAGWLARPGKDDMLGDLE
ncbi:MULTISPECIES: hypothetical protein [Rhodanobacter]|uniref:hypothetical protein n=1 Tax=Rhodanobacter TaxID=75309 RepID=UPI00041CBDC2|nr:MULTISPECIES: hypothetical protein [Rhodanobacter]KZC21758.1 hypothetical protein RHOFW104R3_19210 [Rhodanobacter denitrificans]UJJ50902.1 hypothetical protein LRK52_16960 [Rhodanobacter denitrificans]UJM93617.1 hypothetical protein LRK32_16865 [Rhodanobacter denitrificans]UJM97148.1 hypothetical protein LRK44_16875 [Rhodanobacter denitrificans]UJN20024.1 hypothetical protein LRK54_09765 [Rhodanobacter denitrificans]